MCRTVTFGFWNCFSPVIEHQSHRAQHCCELIERRAASAGTSISWKAATDLGSFRAQGPSAGIPTSKYPWLSGPNEGRLPGPLLKLIP